MKDERFLGYKVIGRRTPPERGSAEWNLLTDAAAQWARVDPPRYEGTAKELLIERDYGVLVHATPRV